MPLYPKIRTQLTEQDLIDSFGGYDHRLRVADGRWYDTKNLSSDFAPLLAPRAPRSDTHLRAAAIGEKEALAYVDEFGTLYYNFLPTPLTGLAPGDKQLVGMGAYLCVFPDKVYLNTENFSDHGSMEARFAPQSASYQMVRADGAAVSASYIQASEPPAAQNGAYWIDSSGERPVLRQWSEAQSSWIPIETVCVRITFETMGVVPSLFRELDGVTISGSSASLNGDKTICALGGGEGEADWITVAGLPAQLPEEPDHSLRIERLVPDADYLCECQNRLWGCRYGLEGAQCVNEIFCCALGDFRNWRQYQGLSTDSWTGSVGSDGPWTGAVNYLGCPTFFKENRVHRVAVAPEGAHAIAESVCRGVQRGGARSLAVVNETLYYMSPSDVCAYQGGFPRGISAVFGEKTYHGAVAGAAGGKYYLSVLDEDGDPSLFVYDIAKDIWLREDELRATAFARAQGALYALADGALLCLAGAPPAIGVTPEEAVEWEAVSGIEYLEQSDHKRVSRYQIRLRMARGASFSVFVQYDSDGVWRSAGSILAGSAATDSYLFPVRPRRCDHLQIKLAGRGDLRVFSLARILEVGSDYR